MQTTQPERLRVIEDFIRKSANTGKSIEQMRSEMEAQALSIPPVQGVKTESTVLAGMKSEIITPDTSPAHSLKTVLYVHGGGFCTGTCNTHHDIAARIAAASRTRVITFEYRLAPEFLYPAANEDCLKAYHALVETGVSENDIVIGGDSVGGYLTLMTLLSLKKNGEPFPKAAFFLSPHTEMLRFDGSSYKTRAELDPSNSLDAISKMVQSYLGRPACTETDSAALSPLNEDLGGLPDLFIQVGGHEVILDDSVRLAENAKKYGVHAMLEVWENMWHTFRFMACMLPEGQQALDQVGAFIDRQLSGI